MNNKSYGNSRPNLGVFVTVLIRSSMEREALALKAVQIGAQSIRQKSPESLTVETKSSGTDYVTEVDRGVQEQIIELITHHYPDDAIVAEEGDSPKSLTADETVWVIDPIDGTTNYVQGIPFWATSVAVVVEGNPRIAVNYVATFDSVFTAGANEVTRDGRRVTVSDTDTLETSVIAPTFRYGRQNGRPYGALVQDVSPVVGDVRRFGSAQSTLTLVAAGHLDAAIGVSGSYPWDTVAGVHMIRKAGGDVTDLAGDRWTPGSDGIVASNGRIQSALLKAISV